MTSVTLINHSDQSHFFNFNSYHNQCWHRSSMPTLPSNTSFHLLKIILCSCFPTLSVGTDHPYQHFLQRATGLFLWDPCLMWLHFSILIFFTGNFNTHQLSASAVWDHPLQLLFLQRQMPFSQPTILYCEALLCSCIFDANLQYFMVRPFYAVAFLMLTFYADIFHPLLLQTSSFLVDLFFWTVVQKIPGQAIDNTTLTNRSLDDQVVDCHIIDEPHHCTVPQPHPLYPHMAFLVCILSARMGWARSTLWVVMSVHLSNSVT